MAKDTRWDRYLSVTPDAEGLIGHAGAVLLRKLADQCGLTSALGAALARDDDGVPVTGPGDSESELERDSADQEQAQVRTETS